MSDSLLLQMIALHHVFAASLIVCRFTKGCCPQRASSLQGHTSLNCFQPLVARTVLVVMEVWCCCASSDPRGAGAMPPRK